MANTKTKQNGLFDVDSFTGAFKASQIDAGKVIEAQRKNVEAMTEANRVALEGYKTVAERQVALVQDAVSEFSGAANDAFAGKTPEANAAKQFEIAQTFMRSALEGAREVAELAAKANQDAFAVLQQRFTDGVEELKAAAK